MSDVVVVWVSKTPGQWLRAELLAKLPGVTRPRFQVAVPVVGAMPLWLTFTHDGGAVWICDMGWSCAQYRLDVTGLDVHWLRDDDDIVDDDDDDDDDDDRAPPWAGKLHGDGGPADAHRWAASLAPCLLGLQFDEVELSWLIDDEVKT